MKKLIVIAGATASGKTDLAIQIARHFETEILSADSRQCYIEMNIGVAKPSPEQLNEIPHHFINSHSIHEDVSAGKYERYGLNVLEKIFSKKDMAVCVGGTGMYIKALCEGIDEMPATDPLIQAEVEENYKQYGIAWLQQEIEKTDPNFFSKGEIENPARLQRALAFSLTTGKSILKFQQNMIKERPFKITKYAIDIEREILYKRINQRVDEMIDDGLIDEVKGLIQYKNLKSLNTVGYAELFNYVDGNSSLEESISKIKQHTRNYAKRQITWFKNQSDFRWMSSEDILDELTP